MEGEAGKGAAAAHPAAAGPDEASAEPVGDAGAGVERADEKGAELDENEAEPEREDAAEEGEAREEKAESSSSSSSDDDDDDGSSAATSRFAADVSAHDHAGVREDPLLAAFLDSTAGEPGAQHVILSSVIEAGVYKPPPPVVDEWTVDLEPEKQRDTLLFNMGVANTGAIVVTRFRRGPDGEKGQLEADGRTRPMDRVTAINGKRTWGMALADASRLMRSSRVRLRLSRERQPTAEEERARVSALLRPAMLVITNTHVFTFPEPLHVDDRRFLVLNAYTQHPLEDIAAACLPYDAEVNPETGDEFARRCDDMTVHLHAGGDDGPASVMVWRCGEGARNEVVDVLSFAYERRHAVGGGMRLNLRNLDLEELHRRLRDGTLATEVRLQRWRYWAEAEPVLQGELLLSPSRASALDDGRGGGNSSSSSSRRNSAADAAAAAAGRDSVWARRWVALFADRFLLNFADKEDMKAFMVVAGSALHPARQLPDDFVFFALDLSRARLRLHRRGFELLVHSDEATWAQLSAVTGAGPDGRRHGRRFSDFFRRRRGRIVVGAGVDGVADFASSAVFGTLPPLQDEQIPLVARHSFLFSASGPLPVPSPSPPKTSRRIPSGGTEMAEIGAPAVSPLPSPSGSASSFDDVSEARAAAGGAGGGGGEEEGEEENGAGGGGPTPTQWQRTLVRAVLPQRSAATVRRVVRAVHGRSPLPPVVPG